MNQKQYLEHVEAIKRMGHEDMARIYRFAPSDHVYFETKIGLSKVFFGRFEKLGGMTPEISKKIGWK